MALQNIPDYSILFAAVFCGGLLVGATTTLIMTSLSEARERKRNRKG